MSNSAASPTYTGGPSAYVFRPRGGSAEAFLRKFDGDQCGMFFGVATRKAGAKQGRREDLAELSVLWATLTATRWG